MGAGPRSEKCVIEGDATFVPRIFIRGCRGGPPGGGATCGWDLIQELANQQQIPGRLLLEAKARAGIRSVRDVKQNCWIFEPVPKLPAPPIPPP